MKKIIALVVFVSGALFTYAQPPAGDANAGDIYGAKVKAKGAVAIAEVVTQLDGGAQLDDVKIKAKILEVCPNKGRPRTHKTNQFLREENQTSRAKRERCDLNNIRS